MILITFLPVYEDNRIKYLYRNVTADGIVIMSYNISIRIKKHMNFTYSKKYVKLLR